MPDAIDNILDCATTVPLAMVQPSYLIEITDRFLKRVQVIVSQLPDRPSVEDEYAFDLEQEYQTAFQEGGTELIGAMEVIVNILLAAPIHIAIAMVERMGRNPAMLTYWGYMTQHTDMDKFRERLG